MSITSFFKKQINKPNMVFPQVIEDSEFIKSMDKAFENRNPYWISVLYRKAASDKDILTSQSMINKGLSEKRDLPIDDTQLIDLMASTYNECKKKYVIFESVGNLIFISELLDELNKNKKISRKIKIACFLWLYQNMIEISLAHLSEIFYMIAINKNETAFQKTYSKAINREQHPMMNELLMFAIRMKFTEQKKNSFLHNNELRNRLAHANCFYDSIREEIILKNDKKLTLNDFEKEFRKVKDFLYELIHRLNDEKQFDIRSEILKMAKKYFKLSRSPQMTLIFKNKIKMD